MRPSPCPLAPVTDPGPSQGKVRTPMTTPSPTSDGPDTPPANVIRLAFRRRDLRASGSPREAPFVLESADGRWTLRGDGTPLDPTALMAAAGTLRRIARDLVERAHASAGLPGNRCLAEFVMYQDGGIDHWIAADGDGEDRKRLASGLRNAIGSLRADAGRAGAPRPQGGVTSGDDR